MHPYWRWSERPVTAPEPATLSAAPQRTPPGQLPADRVATAKGDDSVQAGGVGVSRVDAQRRRAHIQRVEHRPVEDAALHLSGDVCGATSAGAITRHEAALRLLHRRVTVDDDRAGALRERLKVALV